MSITKTGVQMNYSYITQERKKVVSNNHVFNLTINFREEFYGLEFLDEKFDCCIEGVDPVRDSIIYEMNKMIFVLMEEIRIDPEWEGKFEDWGDQYDYCMERVFDEFNQFGDNNPSFPTLIEKY